MANLDIKCIGFKTMFTGEKMYHYKLNHEGAEHLIVDAKMIRLLTMKWVNNKMINSDLWDDFERPITQMEKDVEQAVKSCRKKNYELKEDEEYSFFTQAEVAPVVKPAVVARLQRCFDRNQINALLSTLNSHIDDGESAVINQEFIDDVKNYLYKEHVNLVEELLGYEVSKDVDGDHRHDGQMVEYDFTFTSPTGLTTSIVTEMCLMVGFNIWETQTID